ncbi:MAG: NAD(P)-binding domain-containing protein [Alphaproteobacteria bacterium]|nr:NAD(P)-binding domain-containing protein [Alphaproteobacteria bacterium]MCB9698852.1 NAD(P)-binding domain-containing protein [Alphaproteobacteria bacterium]
MITIVVTLLGVVLVFGLVLVAVWTVFAFANHGQQELVAHKALKTAEKAGAQPASLHPRVDVDRCIGSGNCIEVCPEKDVLAIIEGKARLANPTACIGHGECLRACPVDAIQLVLGSARRGVDIPLVASDFQTSVPGLYVVGELGGMGLVYNAMTQALQAMHGIVAHPPPRVHGVHQVVVVGAGPAGIAATLAAKDAGLDVMTVDQESLGGTVLHYPRHKIVMTRPVDLPLYGRLHVTEVRKEKLLELWQDIVRKTGITVREGVRVESCKRSEDGVFVLATTGGELRAQRVVLALGRRGSPRKLDVPGEDQAKVVYRLLEPEPYAGRNVLVVGGGDSAVEAAVTLFEVGAKVTLVHRGATFDRIKPKNQQKLDKARKAGLDVRTEAKTREILDDAVVIEAGGKREELPNDDVLVLVGGVLPTAFLEAAGVEVQRFSGQAYAPANR